ncbi:hypothetical protein P0W64_13850 [Tsukamurella sp. 8F]|uniref:hypothetical protein n=1 Tax=unclassified Tsukamurella TaxID=2633480 RepID=UPI0023B99E2F|nr:MULTISPECIES: hypothetical protein [unclassified Tsukamurella]MDF0530656.1 hypothetical protein [Tsukamurella sp. 8J]MDF0587857.1 hypothetical protein [Tsukamurella sp. 8F]
MSVRIVLINPLDDTLRHFETELMESLAAAGYHDVEWDRGPQAEGRNNTWSKLAVAARTVAHRLRLAWTTTNKTVLVVWPIFGYFDILTTALLTRRNRVFTIVHDPTPLRESYGYSPWARRAFAATVRRTRTEIIYHTETARAAGVKATGVNGLVLPHPIRQDGPESIGTNRTTPPIVRVVGQNKRTRSLSALTRIANDLRDEAVLDIHGRGWPDMDGWNVSDRFIPEDRFDQIVREAACIVIPYDEFYQSGVAVRCLEAGVPVVGPRHEHIAELYGHDWPGLVDDDDWSGAIRRVLALDPAHTEARRSAVRVLVRTAWAGALDR